MVIDGSSDSDRRIKSMLHWDVNNGIARRAWARNKEAIIAIERAMEQEPKLKITVPNLVDDRLLDEI
jgi:urocanate hydratase